MKRAFALCLFLMLSNLLYAQQQDGPRMPQPQRGDEPQFFFYEAVNLLAEDSTLSRIDIPYRIDAQFFVAVKSDDPTFPFPFKRRGEVLLELVDEAGVSKARSIQRFDIGETSTENGSETKKWREGFASFTVKPGTYTIVFEIDDLESERSFLDKERKVHAKKFDGSVFDVSTPLFVEQAATEAPVAPLNYGGNLLFGKGAAMFLQVRLRDASIEPLRVEYTISTMSFPSQEPKAVYSDTLTNVIPLERPLLLASKESDAPRYSFGATVTRGVSAFFVPLKAEHLPLRPFMLDMKIMQGKSETSIKTPFRMVWPEMPMSLRDIEFALEALRHITREDELDSLRSGNRDARLMHLEQFWKKKDKTPETEYNEVMIEYYRRVDFAMRTYSSMRGGDGFKSDRGRIYILYGPPTKSDRNLDPSLGFQEIWIYEKQNKKFVFADQSKSGNYTLVATQNL